MRKVGNNFVLKIRVMPESGALRAGNLRRPSDLNYGDTILVEEYDRDCNGQKIVRKHGDEERLLSAWWCITDGDEQEGGGQGRNTVRASMTTIPVPNLIEEDLDDIECDLEIRRVTAAIDLGDSECGPE